MPQVPTLRNPRYSFLGTKQVLEKEDGEQRSIFIYGMPDDSHSIPPSNARKGPETLRLASQFISNSGLPRDGLIDRVSEARICQNMQLFDCGDYDFPKSVYELQVIRDQIKHNLLERSLNVLLLGDDSCNFPFLVGRSGLLIHIDAHDDRSAKHDYLTHGNFLRFLINESRNLEVIQYGLREMRSTRRVPAPSKRVNHALSLTSLARMLSLYPTNTPCAICIDSDVIDPTIISSVVCPEPDGLLPQEILRAIDVISCSNLKTDILSISEFSPDKPKKISTMVQALQLVKLLLRSIDLLITSNPRRKGEKREVQS